MGLEGISAGLHATVLLCCCVAAGPADVVLALHACGSRFTSKPYVASGAYIGRQSNYCAGCRYNPAERTGDAACPYTTLYWHFISRHEKTLAANPRTALMAKNLQKLSSEELAGIAKRAAVLLKDLEAL